MVTCPGRLSFDWFGTRVEIDTDNAALWGMIRRQWDCLTADGELGTVCRYVAELDPPSGPRLIGPGWTRELDRRHPVLHAYNLLHQDLLGQVGDHFAFHATSVARGQRALVLSAPSTFGKTTLALHLATRGFVLLADDVTMVDRSTGWVRPFARPLTLRPGTRATLSPSDLRRAEQASRPTDRDDWVVEPTLWPGVATEPSPISMVVLMRGDGDPQAVRRFPHYEIQVVQGSEESLGALAELPGVRRVERHDRAPWKVHVTVDDATALSGWLRDHREQLVSTVKNANATPDFDSAPSLQPIGRFQAALELAQEMHNRHEGSRLSEEFRGREGLLPASVAALLASARCYALRPGRLHETVELLAARFEEADA